MKVISSSHKPFYVELLHHFYSNVIIFLCLYPHLPSSLCPRIINLFLSCLTLSMVEWWADRGKEKKMWAQPICADTQRRSCGRKVSHNREGGEKIVPAKREKERKRREYQERKKKNVFIYHVMARLKCSFNVPDQSCKRLLETSESNRTWNSNIVRMESKTK